MRSLKTPPHPLLAIGALVALLLTTPVSAQPGPGARGGGPGMMMGPGMAMGPGMGPGMMGRGMCDLRAAGLVEWRIERIERAIQPTDAQRDALNELKAASTKAAEKIAGACPRKFPETATARLELMEKRLETMLEAVKIVRPAFDALYASLTSEQKSALDRVGPRHWRWQGWHWRQSER